MLLVASFIHLVGTPTVAIFMFRPLIKSDTSSIQIPLNMRKIRAYVYEMFI